jgi:uncharacterized protein
MQRFKLSKHLLKIPDFPEPGKTLYFQTRTRAQILGDEELAALLKKIPDETSFEQQKTLEVLKRMGIVTFEDFDEDALIRKWFETIRNKRQSLEATILTTYSCNFACTYCVEGEDHPDIKMDNKTAYRTSQFVREKFEKHQPGMVDLVFYGGEPLLNEEPIQIIVSQVRCFSEERGIPFSFRLITNGSLLTPKKVDELKVMGLRQVKVTLDGTREFHNKRRPFRNGKPSYDIIMNNIDYAATKVLVHIGGNFDRENADSMIQLLEELDTRGLRDKIAMVSFKPISKSIPDIENPVRPGTELRCDYADPETAHTVFKLWKEARIRGFKVLKTVGMDLCSMTTNPLMFVIDPKGKIFRCPAFVGYNNFISGDIYRGEEERLPARNIEEECLRCPYVPLCGDGCSYASFVLYGDENKRVCQKDYMEYIVKENIKFNYRLSHSM